VPVVGGSVVGELFVGVDGPDTLMATKLVVDLFCGAGGSSTGAKRALAKHGHAMDLLCVNHWPTAIETHKRNHPEARHYCQDVATVRPHLVVPGGYLDLLMASPTCIYHSRARGGKPTSDQQRMDPWHIIAWLTELRVRCLLVENVPEFVDWGPVNMRSGRPLPSRRGEYFRQWVETIRGLGFRVDWRILNAADYGDATTRHRFFLIARSDRKPLCWPEPTHAQGGQEDALFGTSRQPWRAAREIIDWSLRGKSIFNRTRALSPKTLARIYAGAVKFKWPEPFLVILRQHMDAQSIDRPVPALTAGGTHVGLVQPQPYVEGFIQANRTHNTAKSLDEPIPPVTTNGGVFIATVAHGNNPGERDGDSRRCRGVAEPLQTIHAGGGKFALVVPQCGGGIVRSVDDPLPTIPGAGAHAMIAPYYGGGSGKTCSSVEDPLPTVTTKDRFGMVVPVTHQDNGDRARDVETDPIPTVTGAHRGELAFVTAGFGERGGQAARVRSVEEPAFTVCAQGHIGLVRPGVDFDILFRMLQPHELAAAMSFNDGEFAYEFSGTKSDINKQIGNAVPCRQAMALVEALICL
jgi:DNA (cytosine-5)-methyltransferase 1